MTVSAVKAEGNEPDATISEIDGVKHIEFAIPGGGGGISITGKKDQVVSFDQNGDLIAKYLQTKDFLRFGLVISSAESDEKETLKSGAAWEESVSPGSIFYIDFGPAGSTAENPYMLINEEKYFFKNGDGTPVKCPPLTTFFFVLVNARSHNLINFGSSVDVDGKVGYTFIPNVETTENGFELSWTNDGELKNPSPVTITNGAAGEKGFSPTVEVTPVTGGNKVVIIDENGPNEFTVKDGTDGKNGTDGNPGAAGFSPTVEVNAVPDGNEVTITDETGPKKFTVKNGTNGTNGSDGLPGEDGFSPVVALSPIEGGTKLSITDKTGEKTAEILDGAQGATGESGVYYGNAAPEDPEIKVWIQEDGNATTIPVASSDTLGGVKADPATQEDTQPVHIGEDGKLVTKPGKSDIPSGGAEGDFLRIVGGVPAWAKIDNAKGVSF